MPASDYPIQESTVASILQAAPSQHKLKVMAPPASHAFVGLLLMKCRHSLCFVPLQEGQGVPSGEDWNEQDQAELDAFVPEQGQGEAVCSTVLG